MKVYYILSFAHLHERLSEHDIALHKLRKLAGIVQSSEKLSHLLPKPSASGSKKPPKGAKPPAEPPAEPDIHERDPVSIPLLFIQTFEIFMCENSIELAQHPNSNPHYTLLGGEHLLEAANSKTVPNLSQARKKAHADVA